MWNDRSKTDSAHIIVQNTTQTPYSIAAHRVAIASPWLYIYPNNVIFVHQVPLDKEDGSQKNSEWKIDISNKSPSTNTKETGSEDAEPREGQTSSISNDDVSNAGDEENESEDENPPPNGESDLSEDEIIRQKLSVRAYHLPGNSWCEDWQMYIKNNHLVSTISHNPMQFFLLHFHYEMHLINVCLRPGVWPMLPPPFASREKTAPAYPPLGFNGVRVDGDEYGVFLG